MTANTRATKQRLEDSLLRAHCLGSAICTRYFNRLRAKIQGLANKRRVLPMKKAPGL
jgi:hypothetical protein